MVEIRVLHTTSELQLAQKLEKAIWGMEPIPIHQTITVIRNGGLMLGAFIEEELIGFSYSFAGFSNGESYLCSHLLGVHPRYQHQGVGKKLKEEQKNAALNMGYSLITWTFDPLESKNAYLNLSKLGGICSTYIENCYGDMDDSLNAGLPTDRFKLEWRIDCRFLTPEGANEFCFPWEYTQEGMPKLTNIELHLSEMEDNEIVLVPVPSFFQRMKWKDRKLGIDWRMKTRTIFQTLFLKGYVATAFEKVQAEPVYYYKLAKRELLEVEDHAN